MNVKHGIKGWIQWTDNRSGSSLPGSLPDRLSPPRAVSLGSTAISVSDAVASNTLSQSRVMSDTLTNDPRQLGRGVNILTGKSGAIDRQ